ncbi:hypothetical protein [Marinomonas sp. 2405UD68-3]|uniref:hypothetical protein n=1 Tax=Marinomonas sp. 2405UD68-3 TaxID=3391835 RepID=UPI0039C8D270
MLTITVFIAVFVSNKTTSNFNPSLFFAGLTLLSFMILLFYWANKGIFTSEETVRLESVIPTLIGIILYSSLISTIPNNTHSIFIVLCFLLAITDLEDTLSSYISSFNGYLILVAMAVYFNEHSDGMWVIVIGMISGIHLLQSLLPDSLKTPIIETFPEADLVAITTFISAMLFSIFTQDFTQLILGVLFLFSSLAMAPLFNEKVDHRDKFRIRLYAILSPATLITLY